MSIHPSLRGVDNLVGERSVFTRKERIQILMKAGKFDAASGSVHGLPKVRTRFNTTWVRGSDPLNYVDRDDRRSGDRLGVGAELPVSRSACCAGRRTSTSAPGSISAAALSGTVPRSSNCPVATNRPTGA